MINEWMEWGTPFWDNHRWHDQVLTSWSSIQCCASFSLWGTWGQTERWLGHRGLVSLRNTVIVRTRWIGRRDEMRVWICMYIYIYVCMYIYIYNVYIYIHTRIHMIQVEIWCATNVYVYIYISYLHTHRITSVFTQLSQVSRDVMFVFWRTCPTFQSHTLRVFWSRNTSFSYPIWWVQTNDSQ